jgi:hypothetical protein
MANTIISKTIQDGKRNTIIKIDIVGDGSGEESAVKIFDASTFLNTTVNKKVNRIQYALNGFSAKLLWDNGSNGKPLLSLVTDHYSDFEFDGGLSNTDITNRTGNILITTTGLGSNDNGSIILYIQSKR